MKQLSLAITTRLSYSAENFVVHQGVKSIIEQLIASLVQPKFSLHFIVGEERTGKSHFAVKLLNMSEEAKRTGKLIEGENFDEWLASDHEEAGGGKVVVVDDVHAYLGTLRAGESGAFVNFVERMRHTKSCVVLFSTHDLNNFHFDDHVRSRLVSGTHFIIGDPAEQDLGALLQGLIRQRGFELSQRKLDFIVRRLPKNIREIEEYTERVQYLSQSLDERANFALLEQALNIHS